MDRRRLLGIGLVVVSAAGFGSGTILSKPIYGTGLMRLASPPEVVSHD